MLQCPSRELATRKEKRTAKNDGTYINYVFNKMKCRKYPYNGQCRVCRSKCQTYSFTQTNSQNQERLVFENSDHFWEKLKQRRRIEEKNGEMKIAHGLRQADSMGLFAIRLQAYFTAFTVNIKRIIRVLPQFGN